MHFSSIAFKTNVQKLFLRRETLEVCKSWTLPWRIGQSIIDFALIKIGWVVLLQLECKLSFRIEVQSLKFFFVANLRLLQRCCLALKCLSDIANYEFAMRCVDICFGLHVVQYLLSEVKIFYQRPSSYQNSMHRNISPYPIQVRTKDTVNSIWSESAIQSLAFSSSWNYQRS